MLMGVVFLMWLPIEDVDTRYVIPLAVGLCAWLGIRFFLSRTGVISIAQLGLGGALTGLAVTPTAVIFISFKSGLHAHGFPDFPLVQVRDLLYSTPSWVLVGLLAGLGLGVWMKWKDGGEELGSGDSNGQQGV